MGCCSSWRETTGINYHSRKAAALRSTFWLRKSNVLENNEAYTPPAWRVTTALPTSLIPFTPYHHRSAF